MAETTYNLTVLIPENSTFSLAQGIEHFRQAAIRAEPLTSETTEKLDGFRVWFGNWAVSAWLDEAADVLDG